MPPEFAPGIPEKGKLSQIPTIEDSFVTPFVLHEHHAKRAGKHFDLRLAIKGKGYSWALRYFPFTSKEKRLAVRQPDHTLKYFSFSGEIEDGYGAGKVYIKDSGKVKILRCSPDYIKFAMINSSTPKEFLLKRTSGNNWLLINYTRTRKDSDPKGKEKYKDLTRKPLDEFLKNKRYAFQPKIDGAHNILLMEKGKFPKLISHRVPKRGNTGIIDHTYKFPGMPLKKVPKDLAGIYRGEVYATDSKGKLLAAEQLGGILNSKTDKSLQTQEDKKITMHMALFGAKKHKELINFLGKSFKDIPTAYSEKEKAKLLDAVKNKKDPLTEEGVVVLDLEKEKTLKYRFRPDYDVYIRKFFEGEGKYKGKGVGGFYYSSTPKGDILGKVGTGFTDKLRKDMLDNPGKYVGRVASLWATRRMKSGALFQPSFNRMHLDK